MASTLLHIHADRGLVDCDSPVAEYWPEFAASEKGRITVRQVMCHEAGLYAISDMVEHGREMLDWHHVTSRIAEAMPRHGPGTAHGYHALTYGWLVGEIVRRVSVNKPFPGLLESELARPLGLGGLYCGVPPTSSIAARLLARGMDGPIEDRRRNTQRILERIGGTAVRCADRR